MKNITIYTLMLGACLSLASCSEVSEEYDNMQKKAEEGLTANEDKGIKEILDIYGGLCEYSVGFNSSNEETTHYFEIRVSNSAAVEKYNSKNLIDLASSNIAYIFFKNLNNEERKAYEEIHVVLTTDAGSKKEFVYTLDKLTIVEDRLPTAEAILDKIESKEFAAISPLLNDLSVYDFNKDELLANIEVYDENFGNITDYYHSGFLFYELESGEKLVHICLMVFRDIQSHEFSADFDIDATVDQAVKIDYKY